jgi:hypothetical protein
LLVLFVLSALLVTGFLTGSPKLEAAPDGLIFIVNDTADKVDKKPGDGVCATKNKTCTLRAAVMEANAHKGTDVIKLQPNTTYVLTRAGEDDDSKKGDLDVLESVQIIGNGATVDANGAVTNDRAFQFTLRKLIPQYSLLTGLTIKGGKTPGGGGGIWNQALLFLEDVTVTTNHADGQGGGILNELFITIQDVTIEFNDCTCNTDQQPGGGGIANRAYLAMLSTTINNNTSLRDGGGIWSDGGQLTIYASTLTLNRADRHGGAIHVQDGDASIKYSTIVGNSADADKDGVGFSGGIYAHSAGSTTLGHTLLAQNANIEPFLFKWEDCHGVFDSTGWNLIFDDQCNIPVADNLFGISPNQDTFDNHGGKTKTYSLKANSVAIDHGNPDHCKTDTSAIPIDQRWFERFADGNGDTNKRCDIGAFEYNSVPYVIDCSGKPTYVSPNVPDDKEVVKPLQVGIGFSAGCADTFRIVVRRGAKNGPLVDKAKGLEFGAYLTTKLARGETYFWRPTACNAQGCTKGPWSSFSVKP